MKNLRHLKNIYPWKIWNIYPCQVSISRGHSPLSSPGPGPLTPPSDPRQVILAYHWSILLILTSDWSILYILTSDLSQGRSPSLSMPPASPLARNSRMRSASLAVTSGHRTPPHSPGTNHTYDSMNGQKSKQVTWPEYWPPIDHVRLGIL